MWNQLFSVQRQSYVFKRKISLKGKILKGKYQVDGSEASREHLLYRLHCVETGKACCWNKGKKMIALAREAEIVLFSEQL